MADNLWKNKKVLITGGTGFLGKHLTDALLKEGAILRIIDFRRPNWDVSGLDFYEADIRDKDRIAKLCPPDINVVFHLAAMPSIARGRFSEYYEVNVKGTQNILEAALDSGIKKFVHVSSSTVYGIPHESPLKENSTLAPIGKYGKSKLEAERLCKLFMEKGMHISIIRPRVIMGPGRIGIFSILFERIKNNKPVYVIGDGRNLFQFTDVRDMASACIKSAEFEDSGLFNIGAAKVLPVKEELGALIKYAKSRSLIICIPALMAGFSLKVLSLLGISPLVDEQFSIADRDFKLDTQYAQQKLGWHALYSNLDSLTQAYDWYVANADSDSGQYNNIFGVLGRFRHSKMGGFQNT